jgi:endoglucanase Acf2/chitodextrinase
VPDTVAVGSGSYARQRPQPDDSTFTAEYQQNKYVDPSPVSEGMYVTDDAPPTPQSNSWWAHNWFTNMDAPHGMVSPTITLPWYTKTTADGLTAIYSDSWLSDPGETQADRNNVKVDSRYTPQLLLGHSAGRFADSRVDDWGDFHTRLSWGVGTETRMDVTLVKGSPFIFAEYTGGNAEITLADLNSNATDDSNVSVWADRGNVLGVTISGIDTKKNYERHFGVFAPSDATWDGVGTSTLSSSLGSGDYLTIAPLPTASTSTLDLLEAYAYNIVRDTRVTYEYVPADSSGTVVSEVRSTFEFVTDDQPESAANGSLAGLMPHQWKHTDAELTDLTYWSPRGTLKVHAGTSFKTTKTYPGILPHLPDEGSYDETVLQSYVDSEEDAQLWSQGVGSETSTYWISKDFDHHLRTIPIAQQVDDTDARDRSITALRKRLEGWLTVSNTNYGVTEAEEAFSYWDEFGSLIGYPAGFYSSEYLNDHHFHYGYFVKAAAELARHDEQFIDEYGDMVDLLIREYQNWERPTSDSLSETTPRDSPKDAFPYLRNFDPYEGHSWASGFGLGSGPNQESSSEAMMASSSVIMWAEHRMATAESDTERETYREMRDTAIAVYTEEMHAIWEYWFDADNDSHPDEWGGNLSESDTHGATGAPGGLSADAYEYAPIVWGDGYHRQTFWGQQTMEEIWGINWLPIDGHSFYLNRDQDYASDMWDRMVEARGGDTDFLTGWKTAAIGYRALSDPDDAVDIAQNDLPIGRKSAHLYHWVHNLAAMGTPTHDVVADVPQAAVFEDDGGNRTYVAYNAAGSTTTVRFSDGFSMDVPANSLGTSNGTVTEGLRDGSPSDPAPPAPTNLTSGSHDTSSVGLSWAPSTADDVTRYIVYRDGTKATEVSANRTSVTIDGLTPDTAYGFAVSAVDDSGTESSTSASLTVVTDSVGTDEPTSTAELTETPTPTPDPAPQAPTNLRSGSHDTSSVGLSWDPSTADDVTQYIVYRDGTKATDVSAGQTSVTISGLAPDTAYEFAVSAVDDSGSESSTTEPLTVTTDSAQSDDRITADNWTATLSETGDSTLRFRFDHDADSEWVDVHYTVNGGIQRNHRMAQQTGSHTHVADDLSTGDTIDYYFTYEEDGLAYDTDSRTYTFGDSGETTPPAAPTELSSPAQQTTSLDISWTASTASDVDHYTVYVRGADQQSVTQGTTAVTIGDLSIGTSYDIYVSVTDTSGNESEKTGPITVSTDNDTTAPTVPENLTSTSHDASSVDLSWDGATDTGTAVSHYNVYIDGETTPTVQASGTSATVSNLSAGTSYDFSVSAVDMQDNESSKTSPITVTTNTTTDTSSTVSGENWNATLTQLDSSRVEFEFDHDADSEWADVHYTINGGTQLNHRMTQQTGSHTHVADDISTGDTIEYYFTYEEDGLAYDTETYEYTA